MVYNVIIMKNYKISYVTLEGDLSHVTIQAYNLEDAKSQLRQEYWDVQEIIQVTNE